MAESQGNPPPNGGQGSDTPEGSQQQDQPKYVTAEELNRAITARFSDFEKRQKNSLTQILAERDKSISTTLTESLKELLGSSLDEKLAALKPKEEEPKPKGNEVPPPGPKPEDSPAFKALQKKLEQLEKTAADEAQKRQEADARRRDTELRTSVLKLLNGHSITGDRAELALGVLVDAKKLVGYQPDSDEIVFKSGDDVLPLADGLKAWVGTDQAKIFLPPKDIRGSGDGPAGNGGAGTNPNNPLANISRALVQHLRAGG